MVAYFVRRMLEGVAGWLLVALLLYSLIVLPAMNFVFQQICNDCGARPQIEKARLQHTYALDQPWPLNSFIWLLDPDITVQEYYVKGYLAMGGSVPSRTYYFERSGLLFGDLGDSMEFYPGRSVLLLYGIHLPTVLAFILGPTVALMLIATYQRRGKVRVYHLTQPERLTRQLQAYVCSWRT